MSEILSLAQKFRTQSEKQAKTIEQEVENATTQLNSFMTAKLQESETIIKQGMTNLDTSNEQLLTMLVTHQTDMSTALETYMSSVQAHTTEHLNQFAEDIEKTIEAYTQHIAYLIEQREDRIAQVIKSEMKKWAIVAGLSALAMLVLGIIIGTMLFNTFSKPTQPMPQPKTLSQTQQPINYGQK
ncbi:MULTISPECIES: MbeB family mobilization protein [unclassified Psychrobacter]|uniref:MbeB family mobilization protein n=1 Tax=unclassified Psychrobacter TaxID=196806 RepID=UPI003F469963